MSLPGEVRAWLRSVVLRRRAEREMHAEMAAHIEQAAERFVARGMSEREALHAARREFGSVSVIQEQARDSRGGRWVDNFVTDVRYAFRYFARTPLTSITIVFTLMIDIGINSAGYSLLNAVMFGTPPGIPRNASLVMIRGLQRFDQAIVMRRYALQEVLAYRAQPAFESLSAWRSFDGIADAGNEGDVSRARATYVLPNFFSTLGVRLEAGTGLRDTDADVTGGVDLTAVVTHGYAVTRFGTAAQAIGKNVKINDVIVTIVGVTPPRFYGVGFTKGDGFFLPLSAMRVVESSRDVAELSNDSAEFKIVARLQPEMSVASALPVVRNVAAAFLGAPGRNKRQAVVGSDVVPLRVDNQVHGKEQRTEDALFTTLLAMLDLIVLLVCTTTVSSLLVGAAVTRRHEIGVRLAMGASRQRIVRQLLTESFILSAAGGALGIALVAGLCRAFAQQLLEFDLTPTWSTVAFTVLFAMITALLCGMSPALHATRQSLSEVLKSSSTNATSRSRLQSTFVVTQIAMAQPILVVLAMFTVLVTGEIRRESELSVDDKLIVAEFDVNSAAHLAGTSDQLRAVMERVSRLPGVVRVIPRSGDNGAQTRVEVRNHGATNVTADIEASGSPQFLSLGLKAVAPEYFTTMNIPIVAGRKFAASDSSATVTPIIVASDFAQKALGGGSVMGRQFCVTRCKGNAPGAGIYEVVGVVPAGKVGSADNGRVLEVFTPLFWSRSGSFLIRTTGSATAVIPAIRVIARAEASRIPVTSLETIASRNRQRRAVMMQISSATAGGGLVTLLLGCIGLYAVVALAVGQRSREIGIRIALGALPTRVVSQFFRSGLRLSLIGLCIGLPLSAAAIRLLGNQVGLPKTNTVVIAMIIAAAVVGVAALATWFPARKAAGVDPLVALRAE